MKTYVMATLAVAALLLLGSCVGKKTVKDTSTTTSKLVLSGKWSLVLLKGAALPEGVNVPTLEIDLQEMRISGFGGCNRYFASIKKQDDAAFEVDAIGATRKACLENQVEDSYLQTLEAVRQYRLTSNRLQLLSQEGDILLEYSVLEKQANPRLHDIWAVTHLGDKEIQLEALPYIEINLEGMSASGNNGCNQFMGPIKRVTDETLIFGDLAMTMQMCEDMQVPHALNQALAAVRSYTLDEINLKLFDESGKLLLMLRKAD